MKNENKKRNNMKRVVATVLAALTLFSCFALSGCGSHKSKSKWSFYDRSDGQRIWVKN